MISCEWDWKDSGGKKIAPERDVEGVTEEKEKGHDLFIL